MVTGWPRRALLGGILIAAFLLRVWHLPARGLCYYDEGSQWRAAYAPAAVAREALAALSEGVWPDRERLRRAVLAHGFPDERVGARHGYVFLQSAAMAIVGLRHDAGFWLNAVLGTLTVLVAYRLGASWRGAAAGLAAATLLAVSPNHVFYSRSGLAHAASVFGVYAGLWMLLSERFRRGTWRWRLAAGCWLGWAVTCHYNLFWIAPLVLGVAAWHAGGSPRRWAPFAVGLIAPAVLIEAVLRAARAAAVPWASMLPTYLEEFVYQFSINTGGYGRSRSTSLFYVVHWIRTEGPVFTACAAAAAAATVTAVRRGLSLANRPAGPVLAGLLFLAHLLYAPLPLKGARTLLVAVPAACVLVGGWLLRAGPKRSAPARVAGGVVLASAVLWMAPVALEAARGKSPYPEVLAAVARRGGVAVTVDDYPVLQTYLRRDDILVAQTGDRSWREALARIRRVSGARKPYLIAVCKAGRYGFSDPVWSERFAIVRVVVDGGRHPVFSVPFGQPLAFDFVDETFRWDRLLSLEGEAYRVDLFDLEGIE